MKKNSIRKILYSKLKEIIISCIALSPYLITAQNAPAIVRQTDSNNSQIKILIDLSESLVNSNQKQAHQFAKQALSLSRNLNNKSGVARSLSVLGDIYLKQPDYSGINNRFDLSKPFYTQSNDRLCETERESQEPNRLPEHKFSNALDAFEQANLLYKQIGDKKGIASSTNNVGVILFLTGNPEKALEKYNEAIKILFELNDSSNLKNLFINKGAIFLELQRYDSALFYFNKELEYNIAVLNPETARSYYRMGSVYHHMNVTETAIQYYDSAITAAINQNDYYTKAISVKKLGLISFKSGEIEKAERLLRDGLLLSEKQGFEDINTEYCHLLSLVYEKSGDFKAALYYYKQYETKKSNILFTQELDYQSNTYIKEKKQNEQILHLKKEKESKKNQVTILISALLIALISFVFIVSLIQVKHKNAIEKALVEQQKTNFNTVLETQEKERKRIASDLHDSVGQLLSLIKLNMSELSDDIPLKTNAHKQIINRSLEIIDEACEEVRAISHALMPGSLIRLGLIAATKDLIRSVNLSSKIKITLYVNGIYKRLNEQFEITFFRILQELINNSLKHSRATKIDVDFSFNHSVLKLSYKDNGEGFEVEKTRNNGGIGWQNINSRLSLVNGKYEIGHNEEWGSIVTILAKTS